VAEDYANFFNPIKKDLFLAFRRMTAEVKVVNRPMLLASRKVATVGDKLFTNNEKRFFYSNNLPLWLKKEEKNFKDRKKTPKIFRKK